MCLALYHGGHCPLNCPGPHLWEKSLSLEWTWMCSQQAPAVLVSTSYKDCTAHHCTALHCTALHCTSHPRKAHFWSTVPAATITLHLFYVDMCWKKNGYTMAVMGYTMAVMGCTMAVMGCTMAVMGCTMAVKEFTMAINQSIIYFETAQIYLCMVLYHSSDVLSQARPRPRPIYRNGRF
jgi:hypothetical protein